VWTSEAAGLVEPSEKTHVPVELADRFGTSDTVAVTLISSDRIFHHENRANFYFIDVEMSQLTNLLLVITTANRLECAMHRC
jgi:hypothetical protein